MAEIEIDIDEYLEEADSGEMIAELRRRAKNEGMAFFSYLIKESDEIKSEHAFLGQITLLQEISIMLGLNHLASKEEIIDEIKKLK